MSLIFFILLGFAFWSWAGPEPRSNDRSGNMSFWLGAALAFHVVVM